MSAESTEFDDLLAQLESTPDYITPIEELPVVEEIVPRLESQPISRSEPEPEPELEPEPAPVVNIIEPIDEFPPEIVPPKTEIVQTNTAVNIQEFIDEFRDEAAEIAQKIEQDRVLSRMVVDHLMEKVQHDEASGVETEALVSALKVMADSNTARVRLLDSRSKLLSSAKPAFAIQQNFASGPSDEDLRKILDDDDEYNGDD